MACASQADSCSMTAQTSAGSSEWFVAIVRAREMRSEGGGGIFEIPVRLCDVVCLIWWEPPHSCGGGALQPALNGVKGAPERSASKDDGFSRGPCAEKIPGLKPTVQVHALPLGLSPAPPAEAGSSHRKAKAKSKARARRPRYERQGQRQKQRQSQKRRRDAGATKGKGKSKNAGKNLAAAAIGIAQVNPADGGLRGVDNSLLLGEFDEQGVDVREVVRRHVFDEEAIHLFVADAAIEPAQKEHELRNRCDRDGPPI